jgi:ribonucleotide reductase beta subunit family protein with ferritin-like domain
LNRILSGETSLVNSLRPSRHPWAWELYLKAQANNWSPTEVPMGKDVEQWRSRGDLSEDEKLLLKRCLGFFAGAESLVSNNLLLSIHRVVNDGECRQYILRQAYEECYAEGTEVLTESGWVDLASLRHGDKVAQYHDDGSVSFIDFSNRVAYRHDGEMVRVRSGDKKVDLLVTPKHRMVVRDERGELIIKEAACVSYAHHEHIICGVKTEGSLDSLSVFDRFQVAFQADGSFQPGKYRNGNRNGGYLMVTFSLTKERKKERLRKIIEDNGFKHTETAGKKTVFRVWVPRDSGLSKDFSWVKLADVTAGWCRKFIDELSRWDGWRLDDYELVGYDTTNALNADIVQAIASLSGWRCKRGIRRDGRKESYKDLHRLSFTPNRDSVCRGVIHKSSEDYHGTVRCVSVPSGMLIVRYNGTVSVSGNSLHNQTVAYVCESLGLDEKEIYQAYMAVPAIRAKDEFLMGLTTDMGGDFAILPYPKKFPSREPLIERYRQFVEEDLKEVQAGTSWPGYKGASEEEAEFFTQLARERLESRRKQLADAEAGNDYWYDQAVKKYNKRKNRAIASRQEALRNIIAYYLICEGLFFYSGFAMLLSFGRQNKMPGISEQVQYTLRDESLHIAFGVGLVNTIIAQEPDVWTPEFQEETRQHFKVATALEIAYVNDVLPRGVLGLNAKLFVGYMEYVVNRRLESIGLAPLFANPKNPFPWMAEAIDLPKQKNFFETRVTEYAVGTLKDDLD